MKHGLNMDDYELKDLIKVTAVYIGMLFVACSTLGLLAIGLTWLSIKVFGL